MTQTIDRLWTSMSLSKEFKQLLTTFPVHLPRYTSYPTAAEFSPVVDSMEIIQNYHDSWSPCSTVSLYLHLPFCPSLCYFCACNKVISTKQSDLDDYLRVLEDEIRLLRETYNIENRIIQIHLGGGSPSYLSCTQLSELHSMVLPLCALDIEKSIEIDPRTFSAEKGSLLHQQGFRRFSLGVQDFDHHVQSLINREQSFELVRETVHEIRLRRDSSVNFDLIYGLPGQTEHGFAETISKVVSLLPDRIALYGYANVPWRAKVQKVFNKYPMPTAEERIRYFAHAVTALREAGYEYIGLDHFALRTDTLCIALRQGNLRRNFMGYTTVKGELLLGTGTSSISDIGTYLYQNACSIAEYKKLLSANSLPITRVIKRTETDQIRAFIIESLMCKRSVTLNAILSAFPQSQSASRIFFEGKNVLERCISPTLVSTADDGIFVTEVGAFFLRFIVSVYDQHLVGAACHNRFSAAI